MPKKQGFDVSFMGEVEADESYFGGNRKGKRGRGSAGEVPVFCLQNEAEKFLQR